MKPDAPPIVYWLIFGVGGAAISFAMNSAYDAEGPDGNLGAAVMWLFLLAMAVGLIAIGGILAIFRKSRDISIAFVAAGLGGLIVSVMKALFMMP